MTGRQIEAQMIRAYRNAGYKVMSFKSYDKSGFIGYRYLCGSFVTDAPRGGYDAIMQEVTDIEITCPACGTTYTAKKNLRGVLCSEFGGGCTEPLPTELRTLINKS